MKVLYVLKGFFVLSFISTNISAFSWWDQTHHLISLVASQNISPEAYEKAQKLLDVVVSYPGEKKLSLNTSDFDTAGSWADAINLYGNQSTLIRHKDCHYTDLLMDKSLAGQDLSYSFAKEKLQSSLDVRPINSITCLKSSIKTLMLSSPTQTQKAIALRFMLHIVGDMVQPLHNISKVDDHTDDRGGNGTVFPQTIWIPTTTGSSSPQTKLHGVWDASLGMFIQFPYRPSEIKQGLYPQSDRDVNNYLAKQLQGQEKFADMLAQISENNQTIEDWVIDGYQIAARHAYSNLDQPWGLYSVYRYDIVENQILKGSIRLSNLLEAIFNPENSSLAFQEIVYNIKKDRTIKPFLLQ